jgi:hypothetical protein
MKGEEPYYANKKSTEKKDQGFHHLLPGTITVYLALLVDLYADKKTT